MPDGGFIRDGNGSRIGEPRLTFDERQLAFDVDHWTVEVERDGENFAEVSKKEVSGEHVLDKIWAVYTFNTPDEFFEDNIGDNQVLTIEEGSVAPPPTRPAPATATPEEPTPDPGGGTPTVIPTPGNFDPVGTIYLPLGTKNADIRAR